MRKFGPGLLVTAAFIGPGTLTTASYAGANFGFALLWAVLFSIITTFTLQEMAIRIGLATRLSLSEAFRQSFNSKYSQGLAIFLVIAAIGIGNAAYEAGNLTGAAVAISSLFNTESLLANSKLWVLFISLIAGALLWWGRYKVLEKALIAMVLAMSVVFIVTFIAVKPDIGAFLKGMLIPSLPKGALLSAVALVGTTIVPYNLFLHASAVQEKWQISEPLEQSLKEARIDAACSIGLGGFITMAIVATSAGAFFLSAKTFSLATMAEQLTPVLGNAAPYLFAIGLFAAGMTSAVAAPIAASYAVCGALGKPADFKSPWFRAVWAIVLATGSLFATLGVKPLTVILFAQVTNGLLLPIIAIYLLYVMNQKQVLKQYANSTFSNIVASILVLIVCALAIYKLVSLF